ncbi:ABC transporter permease [Lactococcus fujiensis]|uniref:ABC transporter permease n=1 Tax=Lactococcus fujiensis JCM 16395 TaxID=1291764 RepID=A0A2A5RK36_9LACT|nr:ABC transporter permease [Lactococcus fujiensis]PCR99534.1 ABC transporter permease [Lactococcus fujiensis JCM 16395]
MEKIKLPKELYEKLELDETNQIEVTEISNDSFKIRSIRQTKAEGAAKWFLVPTFVASILFIVALVTLGINHVIPLSGNKSIATGIIVISNAIGMLSFIISYLLRRKELYHQMTSKVYWRTFLTVIISVFLIVTLALSAFFWFINQIFHGVAFDLTTAVVIYSIFTGIINYILLFVVDVFEISMLVNMLIMVSIGGVISSMASNGNQYWWQRNFSILGTSNSNASFQFNLTLILSAALMIGLFDYLFVAIRNKFGQHWRHIILQLLLSLAAGSIGMVGLIPNNGQGLAHIAHDVFAQLIVLFMGLAILGIRWFLPHVEKTIYYISYAIVGFLALSYYLWHFVHYFTLTAFEILSFSLSFAWIMLLINTLLQMVWNIKKVYQVELIDEKNEKTTSE